MDFSIAPDLQSLLLRARAILDDDVIPLERQYLNGGMAAIEEPMRAVREKVRVQGLWAPPIGKDHGGMGLGLVDHGLLLEQIGRSPLGLYAFGCQAPDCGNMELLALAGNATQQKEFLDPLVAGEVRSFFGMTEPGRAGANPILLDCTAVREGEEWVINGFKWFSTGADGAAFAIVMAVTDPEADPHARASMILVPTSSPGFSIVRNISVMGEPGNGWASHSEVRFANVRVPAKNLLGPRGEGFKLAQGRLGPGRIHHCMRWIGLGNRALDMMCDRALDRALDDQDHLSDRQLVRGFIAESKAELDAARYATLACADTIEKRGFRAARAEISAIKFLVAGTMLRVVDRAIQVHGALGITDDTILAHIYAHERGARIYDGPDEVHKDVVAKTVMRQRKKARALDGTAGVRPGEELNTAALDVWLEANVDVDGAKLCGPLRVRQFPSGHSNLTYVLDKGGVELVLRRPPFGSTVKSAHDMGREHKVLSALSPSWGRVPRPLAFCDDHDVIGADFYLTTRERGVVYRRDPPAGVVLDETTVRGLSVSLIDTLADLHALDPDEVGLSDLGKPEGYVARQVKGWIGRYEDAATDDLPQAAKVAKWLDDHQPASGKGRVIHNDYKFDNVMYARSAPGENPRVIAVFDWEMATVGDALMDLGTTLCYWVEPEDAPISHQARFGPTHLPGAFTRREVVSHYEQKTGRSVDNVAFYYAFGLYKTAVVCQQIYARFKAGKTKDPRFEFMAVAVQALLDKAEAQIASDTLL